MGIHIASRNLKLGRVYNISFSTNSCANDFCAYRELCYAKTLERRYPNALAAWKDNEVFFAEHDVDYLVVTMRMILSGPKRSEMFRWLISGEHTDRSWQVALKLARHMPGWRFMSYTKRPELGQDKRPDNLVLLQSWPVILDDPGQIEWAHTFAKQGGFDGVSVVSHTITTCEHQLGGRTCEQCKRCWQGHSVVLRLHK